MNFLDYAIIIAYLAGLLGLGYFLRRQEGREAYFLGDRQLGWRALTLSVMATQLSAISFVSAPAFVGLREGGGLKWLSYELAVPLAMLILMGAVLPALHRSGVVSVYDFLERRFARSTRLMLSFVFQLSRSFATAIMIYALSIILQGTIGLDFWASVTLVGVSTVIYSLQGGMKAVVLGDAIQMSIIIFGAVLCIVFGLHALGGIDIFLANIDKSRLTAIDFSSFGFSGDAFGFWPMLFGGLVLYASYYGCDQTEAQRSLSAANEKDLKSILLANGLIRFPITLIYCTAGLVIGTLAMITPEFMEQIPKDKPDWMMPVFIVNYLPNGVIGLMVVAILAAAMSSLSSAINSLSAVSVEDYVRITGKTLSMTAYMNHAKIGAIIWGIITLTLSFFAGSIAPTVIEAINLVGSVFYGPILALFLLAVMSRFLTAFHANTGLLAGVSANIFTHFFLENVFWFWYNAIGFIVAIITAFTCSLIFKRKPKPKQIAHDRHVSIVKPRDVVLLVGAFAIMLAVGLGLNALAT